MHLAHKSEKGQWPIEANLSWAGSALHFEFIALPQSTKMLYNVDQYPARFKSCIQSGGSTSQRLDTLRQAPKNGHLLLSKGCILCGSLSERFNSCLRFAVHPVKSSIWRRGCWRDTRQVGRERGIFLYVALVLCSLLRKVPQNCLPCKEKIRKISISVSSH